MASLRGAALGRPAAQAKDKRFHAGPPPVRCEPERLLRIKKMKERTGEVV